MTSTSPTSTGVIVRANTDPDLEFSFSYYNGDTTSNKRPTAAFRHDSWSERAWVTFWPSKATMYQKDDGGATETLVENFSADTLEDKWYDVRIVADGATVKVYGANAVCAIVSRTTPSIYMPLLVALFWVDR